MRYRIYKESFDTYRVHDTLSGEIVSAGSNLQVVGAIFKVDQQAYFNAKKLDFANSGDNKDYFAWIETDTIYLNRGRMTGIEVYFNPHKGNYFKYRSNDTQVLSAEVVQIEGNKLSIIK